MSLQPQKLREVVFQMLFSLEFFPCDDQDLVLLFMNELKLSKKNVQTALDIAHKVLQQKEAIDREIVRRVEGYSLERLHTVERNILRLGIFELLDCLDVPVKVVINEAV